LISQPSTDDPDQRGKFVRSVAGLSRVLRGARVDAAIAIIPSYASPTSLLAAFGLDSIFVTGDGFGRLANGLRTPTCRIGAFSHSRSNF
jgi:hypothetical protein